MSFCLVAAAGVNEAIQGQLFCRRRAQSGR